MVECYLVKLEASAYYFAKSNTPWVVFTFFKLYKWYQIARSATCISFYNKTSLKLHQQFTKIKLKFRKKLHLQSKKIEETFI